MATPTQSTSDPVRLVGRCEVFDEIAAGGMATIHIGRMRGAGGFSRTVAVKRMHAHMSRSPDFLAMFLDEASIVARVSHPNVVATLDLVEDGGDLFIIMEYVEGLALAVLLRAAQLKGERAPPSVAARIVGETLQGLHAAHEATDEDGEPMNIVHRDVSPENILVGVDGYPRVLDFGVARASSRMSTTREGHVKGKLAYMAPEQVLGMPLDRRADVFAASAILWQALTGRRLWKADNIVELAHKMLNDPVAPPSEVTADVPSRYDAIVLRGLERSVAKRWPTAAAMAEALEAAGGIASHRDVGLWVRRLGSPEIAGLAAKVAAVEARDKAGRAVAGGRRRKASFVDAGGADAKLDELLAEAEREGLRGPPIPDRVGGQAGSSTPADPHLWTDSDAFAAIDRDSNPETPLLSADEVLEAEASRKESVHRAEAPTRIPPAKPLVADGLSDPETHDDEPATVKVSLQEMLEGAVLSPDIQARLKASTATASPTAAAKVGPAAKPPVTSAPPQTAVPAARPPVTAAALPTAAPAARLAGAPAVMSLSEPAPGRALVRRWKPLAAGAALAGTVVIVFLAARSLKSVPGGVEPSTAAATTLSTADEPSVPALPVQAAGGAAGTDARTSPAATSVSRDETPARASASATAAPSEAATAAVPAVAATSAPTATPEFTPHPPAPKAPTTGQPSIYSQD